MFITQNALRAIFFLLEENFTSEGTLPWWCDKLYDELLTIFSGYNESDNDEPDNSAHVDYQLSLKRMYNLFRTIGEECIKRKEGFFEIKEAVNFLTNVTEYNFRKHMFSIKEALDGLYENHKDSQMADIIEEDPDIPF